MDFITSLLVAVKSLVFMGGYIAPDNVPVRIADPQIAVTRTEVRMRCTVANAYSTELRKLAQSGTPIVMYLFTEARRVRKDSVVGSAAVESRLEYDLVSRRYRVIKSVGRDTIASFAIDSAVSAACEFDGLVVLSKDAVKPDASYYFTVWAILGKSSVEVLGGKEIDLMYFWSYRRPTLKTEPIKGDQILALPK